MFLLRAQIIRLILGTGQFGWWETRLTAASLGLFAVGIFAGSLVPILNKAFFALKDTKTPVVVGIVYMILTIVFCFWFSGLLQTENSFSNFWIDFLRLHNIPDIAVIGLPLGFSLAILIQLFLLFLLLYKKLGSFDFKNIWVSARKALFASLVMAVIGYFVRQEVGEIISMETFFGVLIQTVATATLALFTYFAIMHVLKSPELKIVTKAIFKNERN